MQNITDLQQDKKIKIVKTEEEKTVEAAMLSGVSIEIKAKSTLNNTCSGDNIINMPTSNKTVLQTLSENEFGDAALFIMIHHDRLIYDRSEKDWYYWNDHFWRLDKLGNAIQGINDLVEKYSEQLAYELFMQHSYEQAEKIDDAISHKTLAKHLSARIKDLRTARRAEIILKLASRGVNGLCTTGECWDRNPMLFGCRNGTIDLTTGQFFPGRQSDMIRTVSPVKWQGFDSPRNTWEKFLLQMNDHDQPIVDCLQRLLGYGITGLNVEHVFPIFWGSAGRNGKGTLFETLKFVLGDFAFKAPAQFLMESGLKSGSNNPDAVTMALYGKRIVWLSETNQTDRLDVAKLKELVGGDTLSARLPYAKRQVEFTPSHLMLIITNMRPRVPANDPALWQRMLLFPLKNSFLDKPNPDNPHEFKADKNLLSKLRQEAPGILAWLVEGCILWQRDGIAAPDNICAATTEYQEYEDVIGDFIKDCCIQDPNNSYLRIERKAIYEAYKTWCDESGHRALAKKRFLDDLGGRFKLSVIDGVRYFSKIGLLP